MINIFLIYGTIIDKRQQTKQTRCQHLTILQGSPTLGLTGIIAVQIKLLCSSLDQWEKSDRSGEEGVKTEDCCLTDMSHNDSTYQSAYVLCTPHSSQPIIWCKVWEYSNIWDPGCRDKWEDSPNLVHMILECHWSTSGRRHHKPVQGPTYTESWLEILLQDVDTFAMLILKTVFM